MQPYQDEPSFQVEDCVFEPYEYVTLYFQGFDLLHENNEWCWCEPWIERDVEGNEVYIHQSPQ